MRLGHNIMYIVSLNK